MTAVAMLTAAVSGSAAASHSKTGLRSVSGVTPSTCGSCESAIGIATPVMNPPITG